ncbi:MAG: twin-arginine translocase TatA/TatE family subunit [Verrucomicrobiota bacterium]
MFGIGFQEMLIILLVVLIFFGPKRLPDLAKSMGKGLAEFKKASEEVRKGIEEAVQEEERAAGESSGPAASPAPHPDLPASAEKPPEPPQPYAPYQESIPFAAPLRRDTTQESRSATPEATASEDATTPRPG